LTTYHGPVGPEHSGEFLDPFALSFIKKFTQVIEDGTITNLSLTITLRIIRCEETVGYLVLNAKVGHLFASEVRLIVGYNGVGDFEETYNVLSKKFNNLLFNNFRE